MDATQMTDAVLSAGAEVAEWQREFMKTAVGSVMKQRARLQWARMTPEMREALKQAAPVATGFIVEGNGKQVRVIALIVAVHIRRRRVEFLLFRRVVLLEDKARRANVHVHVFHHFQTVYRFRAAIAIGADGVAGFLFAVDDVHGNGGV